MGFRRVRVRVSSADGPEILRKKGHDREGPYVGPREQGCQKDKNDEGEELVRHESHDRPADRMLPLPPQICVKSCAKRRGIGISRHGAGSIFSIVSAAGRPSGQGADAARDRLRSFPCCTAPNRFPIPRIRSEEHTSELQSLMRISYAVFCLKNKKYTTNAKQQ